jgi:hypothetical protein
LQNNIFLELKSQKKIDEESDDEEEELMPGEMSFQEVEKLFGKGLNEARVWKM